MRPPLGRYRRPTMCGRTLAIRPIPWRPDSAIVCASPKEDGMKAMVFAQTGGPEVLALAEAPKPEPRAGWVLIKNHAIGVNFADTRFRQGTYTVKPKLPDIPGMEVAGVVEAVGDGVTNVR